MRTALVIGVIGVLAATACSGEQNAGTGATTTTTTTPSSTSSSAAADPQKVGFADDLCGAVAKFVVPAANWRPDTSSQAAAVNSFKTQLSMLSTGLTEATQDLNDVDTAGVPDGQAAVNDLKTTFGQMKQTVDQSKAKLDTVNPNNTQALATALQEVTQQLSSMGSMKNPLDQPALSGPDMEAAAARADECQKIKQVIANRTTGSATRTS